MNAAYISLFSGIGGLEPTSGAPVVFCEADEKSRKVLARMYPGTPLHNDVKQLKCGSAEYVLGGWPCQDLSIAGLMKGLQGERSGLFYELIRIIKQSKAHTAIMENVPGLLVSNGGNDFKEVICALSDAGLRHVSWRSINSSELGLPQYRERIFFVASRYKEKALALHADKPPAPRGTKSTRCPEVLGFYWTGGARSLCIKQNAVPALKVGAPSEKGGTSPIAVFYRDTVRKLLPLEAVRIQGFEAKHFADVGYGDILRMAGDAVSRPVGAFVVDSVFKSAVEPSVDLTPNSKSHIPEHGYWHNGKLLSVRHRRHFRPNHIWEYLDPEATNELSPQASAGLCCRIIRAEADVPVDLFETLYEKSKNRTKLLGTKVDSFRILHSELDAGGYLRRLRCKVKDRQLELFQSSLSD